MKVFKTIKANILAVLIFAVTIVGLNAVANQYTNRLKNFNNNLTRKSQIIQVHVQENLMLEAQYINKRDPVILNQISEIGAKIKTMLSSMKSKSAR